MKKIYTDEQIVGFLGEAERAEQSIREFCRAIGLNETTFHKWKRKFDAMEVERSSAVQTITAEHAPTLPTAPMLLAISAI